MTTVPQVTSRQPRVSCFKKAGGCAGLPGYRPSGPQASGFSWLLLWLLLPAGGALALDTQGYLAGREDYRRCGEAYAASDDTAFVNGLERMMRIYKGEPWGHEARLALALFLADTPAKREATRQLLRQTALDARALPFSRAAQFMLGRSYEEEGMFAQAAKEYQQLLEMPALLPVLEDIEAKRAGAERLPVFCVNTESANFMRWRAGERLLNIDHVRPDASVKLPPTVKSVAAGETLLLDLSGGRHESSETRLLLRLLGGDAGVLAARLSLERTSDAGCFRIEVQPLHPVGCGFHLPKVVAVDTEREVSSVLLTFDAPYRVYAVHLSWRDVVPRIMEIAPLQRKGDRLISPGGLLDAGNAGPLFPSGVQTRPANQENKSAPFSLRYANILSAMLAKAQGAPVACGIASLQLRYDPEKRRFVMLLAAPAAPLLAPAAPSNLYVLYSADGLAWAPPRLLPASSMRDDLWPDIAYHAGKARLAWVSSRRGPGMQDLFYAVGDDAAAVGEMRCLSFVPEQLAGMPGWVQVTISSPVFLYADGRWQLFFLARGLGGSPASGSPVRLKASSIYRLVVGAPLPDQLPPVLAATRGDLDRYVGPPEPGQPSPFVSASTAMSAVVDARGCPAIAWVTDSGIPCVTVRGQTNEWQTQKMWLQPRYKGGPPVRARAISVVNFRDTLYALASVEGEGVVLYAGRDWNALLRVRPLYEEVVYPFHTALVASPDPGGRLIAAYAPMGPYSTAVAVEQVAP